jgi:hypothetical protein
MRSIPEIPGSQLIVIDPVLNWCEQADALIEPSPERKSDEYRQTRRSPGIFLDLRIIADALAGGRVDFEMSVCGELKPSTA